MTQLTLDRPRGIKILLPLMMRTVASPGGKTDAVECQCNDLSSGRRKHIRAGTRRRIILREFLGEEPTGNDVVGAEEVVRAAGSPSPTSADHSIVLYTRQRRRCGTYRVAVAVLNRPGIDPSDLLAPSLSPPTTFSQVPLFLSDFFFAPTVRGHQSRDFRPMGVTAPAVLIRLFIFVEQI